jgi:hypothetical protein
MYMYLRPLVDNIIVNRKTMPCFAQRATQGEKENPVCPVYTSVCPYDPFLLANYPSGAVDIGEGVVYPA